MYCVAGRSSSTAFQRLINSSNKVWMWGEQHGTIDDAVTLINQMQVLYNSETIKHSVTHMYDSYTNNKHTNFYPNAIGNLDTTIDIVNSAISNLLKPWTPAVKRFGFKDIEVKTIKTLEYLKQAFPQSFILFCFRDPVKQWSSVHALANWWGYGNNVKLFLDEYYRLSNIYMEYAAKNNIIAFVESSDLRNPDKVKAIIKYINIPKIDFDLLNITVHSANGPEPSNGDKDEILNSGAYKNYLAMKNISARFFN